MFVQAAMKICHLSILGAGLIFASGCHTNDETEEPVQLSSIEQLLSNGSADACALYDTTQFPNHQKYICVADNGYSYQVDIPAHGEIETVVMILHSSKSDPYETRGMLAANTDSTDFHSALIIYPHAKSYGFGGLVSATLWNGSGEREAGDNGCCVNNGLSDREFISGLVREAKIALPQQPLHLVGLSNGGMLAFDLAYNTQLDVETYFVVVGSDQTRTRNNVFVASNMVLMAIKDDEVIPYYGGMMDLGSNTELLAHINADNDYVWAPPFTETVESLLIMNKCARELPNSYTSALAQAVVTEYQCEYGAVATFEMESGGHRLGSGSLLDRTAQRRDVIGYIGKVIYQH